MGLLSQLDSFRGLNSLHIDISSFYLTLNPDDIIAELNCPHLKRLVLRSSDRLVYLGDKLPRLEVLEIYPRFDIDETDQGCEGSDEKWDKLNALKNRGIDFLHTPIINDKIGLLAFVFQYAERRQIDPTPLARWLILSQTRSQTTSTPVISLRRFSPPHRDAALQIIKDLDFEEDHKFEIRLHADDTLSLARRLPETITSLDIVIPKHNKISPVVINEIIRRLPKIKELFVHLYLGFIEEGGEQVGAESSFHVMEANQGPHDLQFAIRYQLNVVRGMSPVRFTICDIDGEDIYSESELGFPKLERGVQEWLVINGVLNKVTLLLDGGVDLVEYY
jgi:hypothetical protein